MICAARGCTTIFCRTILICSPGFVGTGRNGGYDGGREGNVDDKGCAGWIVEFPVICSI